MNSDVIYYPFEVLLPSIEDIPYNPLIKLTNQRPFAPHPPVA